MELDGTTITTLQTPSGEVKGLGTGASVWDTAIVLARYVHPSPSPTTFRSLPGFTSSSAGRQQRFYLRTSNLLPFLFARV
jgi:hypothetical protein